MGKIKELHVPCEQCGSSDARCVWDDGHGYCFSCKHYSGNGNHDDRSFHYEYMPWRGVEKATFEHYGCLTKVAPNGEPVAIAFKYPNNGLKVRNRLDKQFYWEGDSKDGLFGRNLFAAGSAKYVTITEGELDALSLYQVVKGPVVSVRSSASGVRDCTADRSWLNSFERIYLAFDSDVPGRELTKAVARLFDYNKVYYVKFSNRKDANEYLENGEAEELKRIWWNSKKYLPEQIVSSFSDFATILKEQPKASVSYPFPTLTEMTYGIRTGESVLITAQEGVGKTELMHSIEYHLLRETQDNIGAIFLEEPKRRHLQALASLSLRRPVHLPEQAIGEDEILAELKKVIQTDDRLHVYSHFGSDEPDVLLDTIRFLSTSRSCRYVLFDHLSMAVSGLAGEDERKALDYLSTRLEMMVKELDFALIFVSHVNDDGKTRGSRYISKVADIRIDLSRDLSATDPLVRNTTHLTVSKNRFCGKTGSAGSLIFDPNTYTYSEVGTEWNVN